ncbi:MAG: protein jag [Dehalococcoidales bacterium]|nr:MAG: protein jag [Dehalococcoidales bacterium]
MEPLEINARTVEEAIQIALTQLNASRDEVKVDVVSEGKSGLLGLGAEEAVIRVERLVTVPESEENASEITRSILERLLELMEIEATVQPQTFQTTNGEEQATSPFAFNVTGEDLGILIGRRGQTLATLQYMVRLIVSHQMKVWTPIVIDVEGYKQRRSEALQTLAVRMAEQVRTRGTPFTLEPMPAYERRIIHLALADHPNVTTQSIGEGDLRKVVILPDKD